MPCIEFLRSCRVSKTGLLAGCAAALLAGCGTRVPEAAAPTVAANVEPNAAPIADASAAVPADMPPAAPAAPLPAPPATTTTTAAPASVQPTAPANPAAAAAALQLVAPRAARNWDEFRIQAAQRLVAANPERTYLGPVPEPLLAIPVLEVELNADGSVKRVQVLRHPTQARDTTQMAIDAVHRAAPYGNMRRLPKPWKWSEVFLFDDGRRFKPRTLDL